MSQGSTLLGRINVFVTFALRAILMKWVIDNFICEAYKGASTLACGELPGHHP